LYLVEEPSDSQTDLKTFGEPDDIISTEDLLENLHKDEKYAVDEDEYIKARLFDMLIGTGTDIMTNGVGLNTKKRVKLFTGLFHVTETKLLKI
jgi:hypothetical protein